MASLISVLPYRQRYTTHVVDCEECEGDEARAAEYIIGTLKLCRQHLSELGENIRYSLSVQS